MNEVDREERYLEALEKLPIDEETKSLMKYVRATRTELGSTNGWLRRIFFVLLAILATLLAAHWDKIFG